MSSEFRQTASWPKVAHYTFDVDAHAHPAEHCSKQNPTRILNRQHQQQQQLMENSYTTQMHAIPRFSTTMASQHTARRRCHTAAGHPSASQVRQTYPNSPRTTALHLAKPAHEAAASNHHTSYGTALKTWFKTCPASKDPSKHDLMGGQDTERT